MLGTMLHSRHTKIGKAGSRLKGMQGSGEETRAGDWSVRQQVLAQTAMFGSTKDEL